MNLGLAVVFVAGPWLVLDAVGYLKEKEIADLRLSLAEVSAVGEVGEPFSALLPLPRPNLYQLHNCPKRHWELGFQSSRCSGFLAALSISCARNVRR